MIFRRFKDVFCWFLHWISWMSAIFYFRSNWPTDLESVSRDAYLAMKVSTKFEDDTTIRCLVIALLLLIRYETLWPWPLTLVSGHTWRVKWSTSPPSLKILRLSVLELWVLTSPIGYHWQCICSHCACDVSRDLCVGGKFSPHIWNPWPQFACSLYNFYGATMTFKGRLLLAPLMLQLFFSR